MKALESKVWDITIYADDTSFVVSLYVDFTTNNIISLEYLPEGIGIVLFF